LSADPLRDFAAGLAKGAFDWTADKASYYVALLRNHEIAFIGRIDLIREAQELGKVPELQFYREYLTDGRLRLLAWMGLVLRQYESDPLRQEDLHALRDRIRKKYKEDGLHIAQVVQSRILAEVIPPVLSNERDKAAAAVTIEAFLNESGRFCIFVKDKDHIDTRIEEVRVRLMALRPPLFVLFARGSAKSVCNTVVIGLSQRRVEYDIQSRDVFGSLIVILFRKDLLRPRPLG